MTLESKLSFLRSHKLWKCMNKTELLEECRQENSEIEKQFIENKATKSRDITLKNGLSDLTYDIISQEPFKNYTNNIIITVDIHLNNHWTDLVCGVDDNQLTLSPAELKTRFDTNKKK